MKCVIRSLFHVIASLFIALIIYPSLPSSNVLAATCNISASPDSIISGKPTNVNVVWTLTDATNPTLNGSLVALSGSQLFIGVNSATSFNLAATDLGGNPMSCSAAIAAIVPPIGGIVPCERLADNPATPYNETSPCTICHIFIMLQIVTNFIFQLGGSIAILLLIVGGLTYALSAGNARWMERGKHAVVYALVGLAIIILGWLIVTTVFAVMGYVNPLGGQWNIVNCSV